MNIRSSIDASALANAERGHRLHRPERLKQVLNFEQLCTLSVQESLGWSVAFVRRPMFQHPVVVIVKDGDYQVIAASGAVKSLYDLRTGDTD